jgi:hypothetical protein
MTMASNPFCARKRLTDLFPRALEYRVIGVHSMKVVIERDDFECLLLDA